VGAGDRFSRTIPKNQVGDTAQWELRPLAGGRRVGDSMPLSARPGETERMRDGYEAGKARGHAEALLAAQQARAADAQRLERLLAALQSEFDGLAGRTADALLELAVDIAAQVLRQEVQTRREVILPVVREALGLVEGASARPTVHLAPIDFELVRGALQADGQLQGCRLLADPAVEPGGCRLESTHGQIDATLATRWRRVVQTLGLATPLAADGAERP
jgi:flagellar assembly protein FliH